MWQVRSKCRSSRSRTAEIDFATFVLDLCVQEMKSDNPLLGGSNIASDVLLFESTGRVMKSEV